MLSVQTSASYCQSGNSDEAKKKLLNIRPLCRFIPTPVWVLSPSRRDRLSTHRYKSAQSNVNDDGDDNVKVIDELFNHNWLPSIFKFGLI